MVFADYVVTSYEYQNHSIRCPSMLLPASSIDEVLPSSSFSHIWDSENYITVIVKVPSSLRSCIYREPMQDKCE